MTIEVGFDTTRPLPLWILSDLHIGHVAFDEELFLSHLALAKQARAKVLFLGDALEAVNTSSKVNQLGGHFEQVGTIGDQRRRFQDYMKGLRVLAILDGNHERRLVRESGESPLEVAAENIARQQKYPCPWRAHGSFVNIRVGAQKYSIVIHHGEGGPTTFFRHLHRDFQGADLYAGGHTHGLSQEEMFVHTATGPRRVINVRSGSYLAFPSYAADKPTSGGIPATGSWLLWLRPDRLSMTLEKLSDREAKAA